MAADSLEYVAAMLTPATKLGLPDRYLGHIGNTAAALRPFGRYWGKLTVKARCELALFVRPNSDYHN